MKPGSLLKVLDILDGEGWRYDRKDNDILLIAAFGARKWKMVISCEGENQVCCFAVFPWVVPSERLSSALTSVNELNFAHSRGCYILNTADMHVVYRCGVQLLDEYSSYDYIKDLLLSSVAAVDAGWEKVYGIICGIGKIDEKSKR